MKRILPFTLLISAFTAAKAQIGDYKLPFVKDSQVAIADPKLKAGGLRTLIIGKNYRREWTSSLRVPVLDFSNYGGLKPEKEGGGKQTLSLTYKDASGREWVSRTVGKAPNNVLPDVFKNTLPEKLMIDGFSASHPFGVLSVGTLAKAANVPWLDNTLVFVPASPALGEYSQKYGNKLALFELRSPDTAKHYSTEEIVTMLQKDSKTLVDQNQILRARLLDNYIMDFDRHDGQWEWIKTGNQFQAIPKDRDQAFFKATGLVSLLTGGQPSTGVLQGFRTRPKDIETLNWAVRNFDRKFLNELDATQWTSAIDAFVKSMTNEVIADALSRQPVATQSFHNRHIEKVLGNKRKHFRKDMLKYYEFISREVSVTGTHENDEMLVSVQADGQLRVIVKDKSGQQTYNRLFDPSVTKEVRLYGLNGSDKFTLEGGDSEIMVRIIGGPDADEYVNKSGLKPKIYDAEFEPSTITGDFKDHRSKDPMVNEYRRIENEYNNSGLGIFPELSREGGLFLGLGYKAVTHGFRKEPYASKHNAFLTRGIKYKAWHGRYIGDFILSKRTAMQIYGDAMLPTVRTRFFGYGNETVLDKSKDQEYYRLSYEQIKFSVMLRHRLGSAFTISYGPAAQYVQVDASDNVGYKIGSLHPEQSNSGLYARKYYAGAQAMFDLDTRNTKVITTRGIHFTGGGRQLWGMNNSSSDLQQVEGSISAYTDFIWKKHIILATSFGGGHNFGTFEIPQAQYLGYRQNLRGYRYTRFAGRSQAYNNSELRVNFGNLNLWLVKGPFGLTGFHDIGRVWSDGENSDKLHRGYGGGVWMAIFDKFVGQALLTFSEEEKAMTLFTLGFQF